MSVLQDSLKAKLRPFGRSAPALLSARLPSRDTALPAKIRRRPRMCVEERLLFAFDTHLRARTPPREDHDVPSLASLAYAFPTPKAWRVPMRPQKECNARDEEARKSHRLSRNRLRKMFKNALLRKKAPQTSPPLEPQPPRLPLFSGRPEVQRHLDAPLVVAATPECNDSTELFPHPPPITERESRDVEPW